MKATLLFIGCLIAFNFLSAQHEIRSIKPKTKALKYDLYGRKVKDEKGLKINFSKEETEPLIHQKAIPSSNSFANPSTGNTGDCDPAWKYAIMGTYIGRNSMNSTDLDGNGKMDIICSAKGWYNSDYHGDYWYSVEYNQAKNIYEHHWISDTYPDQITRMKVVDINSDGISEILVGFDNGLVIIYNGLSKVEIERFTVAAGEQINDIDFGDADNDGLNEIVFSTDESIYLYRSADFSLENELAFGCFELAIGNVDGTADLEIVTSKGKVLLCNGSTVTAKWSYDTGTEYDMEFRVELSDIDSDGKKEIIRAKSWYYIDVYDADIQALKFEIETDLDIDAMLIQDVNNDNIDEIIYGDGQWGEVHCINSISKNEMWTLNNPEHGVTAINVADVNNDGFSEVIWGAGFTSTGPDYLYVGDIASETIDWQSQDIVGPYYAVEIDDIDNDGSKEIVALSYESESGYSGGVLMVFNAVTHELEWQNDGDLFQSVWTGFYDLKIKDIDNDGHKEIVLAAGDAYTGEIWIIDGVTKAIKSSHTFYTENIDEFYVLDIGDIDDDGNQEIVALGESFYYIINPINYSVKYTSGSLSGSYYPTSLRIENINNSSEKEIVICKGQLMIYGGISHTQWLSQENDYTCMDLYDFDGDGKKDIILGNSEGTIVVLNGITYATIQSFNLTSNRIDGVRVSDLNGDTKPDFVFTSQGAIYIYSDTNQVLITRRFGGITGGYNGLRIADIDNDNKKEIITGSSSRILEMTDNCYHCMWLYTEKTVSNVSCGVTNDGSVSLLASGGASPYSYSWNTGSSSPSLTNLPIGWYIATVLDGVGCSLVDSTLIKQSRIVASYESTNESCMPAHDGSATVIITEGTPPFSYTWSNGQQGPSISNLSAGNYDITVNDSRNCAASHTFNIEKDTLYLSFLVNNVSCNGYANGNILAYPFQGTPPFTYQWNTGQTNSGLYHVGAGTYTVQVTDSHGCKALGSDSIMEPSKILTSMSSTADNPASAFGEGTATVNVIGGNPPYYLSWNDPFLQTTVTAVNLLAGTYVVEVEDQTGCRVINSVIVSNIYGFGEPEPDDIILYPNPSKGLIYLDFETSTIQTAEVEVYDVLGDIVFIKPGITLTDGILELNLPGLKTGMYNLLLKTDKGLKNFKFQVLK